MDVPLDQLWTSRPRISKQQYFDLTTKGDKTITKGRLSLFNYVFSTKNGLMGGAHIYKIIK